MSTASPHLERLRDLTRVRAARARLALSEASRERQAHSSAQAALAALLSTAELVSGRAGRIGMWASLRRAEAECQRARAAAAEAWERYRVATLRLDTLVSRWKQELATAERRKLDREDETLADECSCHVVARHK